MVDRETFLVHYCGRGQVTIQLEPLVSSFSHLVTFCSLSIALILFTCLLVNGGPLLSTLPLSMHLYNLTLEHASAIPNAVVGNFSGLRQQEILISRGTRLQLLRPDPTLGKLSTVLVHDVFGSIRSLAAFRLTGGTKGKSATGVSTFLD
jgi:hypothetical protein